MPPAAAVVPSPSGTPPSSSPKVASPQAASLPSSSTQHNATAGRDAMSSIHHREGATSLLPSSSPIVAKPPKKRAVVVAGLSTSSTATRDDSTTTTTHPPSSTSQQQNTTPPPPQRVCSRCACLSSCAWHKSKTTANASLCETCYRCEALELVDKKCHSCETTKTSRQWYKSKIAVGDLCKRCYRIELVALQHKTCIACSRPCSAVSCMGSLRPLACGCVDVKSHSPGSREGTFCPGRDRCNSAWMSTAAKLIDEEFQTRPASNIMN